MKIGEPVKEMPGSHLGRKSKYGDVYRSLDALVNGDWLPVEFDSEREARTFQVTCMTHRTRQIEARLRGSVVYVRNQKPLPDPPERS